MAKRSFLGQFAVTSPDRIGDGDVSSLHTCADGEPIGVSEVPALVEASESDEYQRYKLERPITAKGRHRHVEVVNADLGVLVTLVEDGSALECLGPNFIEVVYDEVNERHLNPDSKLGQRSQAGLPPCEVQRDDVCYCGRIRCLDDEAATGTSAHSCDMVMLQKAHGLPEDHAADTVPFCECWLIADEMSRSESSGNNALVNLPSNPLSPFLANRPSKSRYRCEQLPHGPLPHEQIRLGAEVAAHRLGRQTGVAR